jgi:hypothetical protein
MRRLMRLTGLDTEENQARRLLNDLDTFRARNNLQGTDEAVAAHQWLATSFEPVVNAIPKDLMGKRDPAQLYHEVLDYRWYQSQRERREVPLTEAVHGYIDDVLTGLPDEALSAESVTLIRQDDPKTLVNPYDPSQGFVDAEEPSVLDMNALLAAKRARKPRST